MKCTDKSSRKKKYLRAKRRRNRQVRFLSVVFVLLSVVAGFTFYGKYLTPEETKIAGFVANRYQGSTYKASMFATDLCVAGTEDVALDGAPDLSSLHAAALFDVNNDKVDYATHLHDQLYPASTTKILTALVAMNNSNLDDIVTVSHNADSTTFSYEEQTCGILEGDQLTLRDLLNGLLLYSGNDTAVAIAEHVAGSEETFAEMMNTEAAKLMATNTHFSNPHGLHEDEHYTTAYDLYLLFNECIKHEEFLTIIESDSYTASITGADGTVREEVWEPTNLYAQGETALPENVTILGGKTGTTNEAGRCLILLVNDKDGNPYISIVMGDSSKEKLYQDMTSLLLSIPEDI